MPKPKPKPDKRLSVIVKIEQKQPDGSKKIIIQSWDRDAWAAEKFKDERDFMNKLTTVFGPPYNEIKEVIWTK